MSQQFPCKFKKNYSSDAAPLGSVRTTAALDQNFPNSVCMLLKTRRLRRRGPRSEGGRLKRLTKQRGPRTGVLPGKSGSDTSVTKVNTRPSFIILCLNIRCLLKNLSELTKHILPLRENTLRQHDKCIDAQVHSRRNFYLKLSNSFN